MLNELHDERLTANRAVILHTTRQESGRINETVFPLHRGPGSPAGVLFWCDLHILNSQKFCLSKYSRSGVYASE
jgi:hypothetical protein